MKNFVQRGDTVPLTAPAGGVKSGDLIIVGGFRGVANHDAPEGEPVETALTGVFSLPKSSAAISVGQRVYWSTTSNAVVTTASGNMAIGAAIKAAASDEATALVRLDGVTI